MVLYISLFYTGPTPYKAGLLWHDPGFSAIRATGLTYFGGDISNLGVDGQSNDYSYRAYIPIVLAAAGRVQDCSHPLLNE